MFATRSLFAMMLPGLGLLLAGCGVTVKTVVAGTKNATEERSLTAPHVPASAIDVQTDVGSVELVADPSAKEVQITAKVIAIGDTEEESTARLQEIKVNVSRREDGVLAIAVEHPKEWEGMHGSCSFVIRAPEANGIKVRTGNGSVTVKGLGGTADVRTGVGAVSVADQGGNVTAHTGNGSVRVTRTAGDVQLTTSVGQVTVQEATGAIKAESGNGSLEVTRASGAVDVKTSVGAVTVREAAGDVTASTGNGSVTVTSVKGAVKAKASVGRVALEAVSGKVEAETGNGSITHAPAAGSASSFSLKTNVGSVTIRLPGSAGGSIQAGTSVGNVTVTGSRQPRSVTGDRMSKQIVLTEKGPTSSVRSGNGSITITLE